MKKALITLLSVLYLMAGIGFGSDQHYCHSIQKTISPDEDSCCSVKSITASMETSQPSEKPGVHCCRDIMTTTEPTNDASTTFSDDCCEFLHEYNQPENATFPFNFAFRYLDQSSGEYHSYPQQIQTDISRYHLISITDPSTHVNLPLII